MNIYTVRDNLKNTIAGKEKMLEELYPTNPYAAEFLSEVEAMVRKATIEFLKININELKKILADVEVCCEKDLEKSWQLNPERMGR